VRNKATRFILLLLITLLGNAAHAQRAYDLAEVLKRGQIRFAFYNEFPPYSDDGKGIDVELAQALAGKLGVRMSPIWFDADENMEDDLRNMVWKGHILGIGPADAMMHVPVDAAYMAKVDKVKFFAPYYRERFGMARNVERIPAGDSMEPFVKEKIGVEGGSLPDTVLLSADAGRYRANIIHFMTAEEAIAALKSGQVAAVMAQQGELEAGLLGNKAFAVGPPPLPLLNIRQWALGVGVKAEHEDLAKALQKAMNELVAEGKVSGIFAKYGVQYRAP